MIIEFFGFENVVADAIEEDERKEALGHFVFEIGDKDAGSLIDSLRSPTGRISQKKNFFPVFERWNDFKSFGKRARSVSTENGSDPRE